MLHKYIISVFLVLTTALPVYADAVGVEPKDEKAKPQTANIYFSAGVNNKSISELGVALNNMAINHPSVKNINMIINSPGGNVDAGKLGYMLVKSSRIPVRAINVGDTSSAATFLFCGAKERAALPGAYFVLHPAAQTMRNVELKPDVLRRLAKEIDNANAFIHDVYKQCTTMTDDEINQMLKAEYLSKNLSVSEASAIKLVNDSQESIPEAGISVFIHDGDKG